MQTNSPRAIFWNESKMYEFAQCFFQSEQQVQWLDTNRARGLRALLPRVLVFPQIWVGDVCACPSPGLCFHRGASCWMWMGQRGGWGHGLKVMARLQNAVPFIVRGKDGNPAGFHNRKSAKTRNALLKLQKF